MTDVRASLSQPASGGELPRQARLWKDGEGVAECAVDCRSAPEVVSGRSRCSLASSLRPKGRWGLEKSGLLGPEGGGTGDLREEGQRNLDFRV